MLAVVHEVRDQVLFIDHSSEERASFVESKDAVIGEVSGDCEDGLRRDAGLKDLFAGSQFIDVDKPELGHDVEESILLGHDQRNREVSGSRSIVYYLCILFELLGTFGRRRYLGNMD